jgi:hypothetical protein
VYRTGEARKPWISFSETENSSRDEYHPVTDSSETGFSRQLSTRRNVDLPPPFDQSVRQTPGTQIKGGMSYDTSSSTLMSSTEIIQSELFPAFPLLNQSKQVIDQEDQHKKNYGKGNATSNSPFPVSMTVAVKNT